MVRIQELAGAGCVCSPSSVGGVCKGCCVCKVCCVCTSLCVSVSV